MDNNDSIEIRVPAELKLKIRNEAARKGIPMGRMLINAWIGNLPKEERPAVRRMLGLTRAGAEFDLEGGCPKCGVSHERIPGKGPWHDKMCEDWMQRGLT